MKKVLCLFSVLAMLICSGTPAFALDDGPGFHNAKVFNMPTLPDNLVAHVQPGFPTLDTDLRFEPVDTGARGATLAHAQHERLHYRAIDPGSKRIS